MSIPSYISGDLVRSSAQFVGLNGVATDPTVVTFTYQAGAGLVQSSTAPVKDSTGLYHYDIDTTGWNGPNNLLYTCQWAGTGAVQQVDLDYFQVSPPAFSGPTNATPREIAVGMWASRPAAQLPQNTTGNIFTVTGGLIRLVQLTGICTHNFDGNAVTIAVQFLGAAAGAVPVAWCTASGSLAGYSAGVHLRLPGDPTGQLYNDQFAGYQYAQGGSGINMPLGYVAPPGSVQLVTVGSNVAALVQWNLYYLPLDDGAAVVAA